MSDQKQLVLGFIFCLCFVIIGYYSQYVSYLFVMGYLAFGAQNNFSNDIDGLKKCLTVWVTFAMISVYDFFLGYIMGYSMFYVAIKMCLFIWIFIPDIRGWSFHLYRFVIFPIKLFENTLTNLFNSIEFGIAKFCRDFLIGFYNGFMEGAQNQQHSEPEPNFQKNPEHIH